jgi:hypothetical protein
LTCAEHDFPVQGARRLRRQARERELVRILVVEPDRKGLDRFLGHACHEDGQPGGIQPAREEQPQRHVAHEVAAHGVLQSGAHLDGLLSDGAADRLGRIGQAPPAPLRDPRSRRPRKKPARQQLAHPAEESLLAGDEARRQELREYVLVEQRLDRTGGQDRLDLRGEDQLVPGQRVIERLDPQPIAGQEEPAPLAVPQGEGEHPAQGLDATILVFLVEMKDRLVVAVRPVAMAPLFQIRPELGVVVDLAVADNPDALVLVRHRLAAALGIHDRQSPMTQADRTLDEQSLPVRAAVTQRVPHPLEAFLLHALVGIELQDADDAAHDDAIRIP